MDLGQWTMLISLGLIWGLSFYLMAVAVTELPVLTIVLLRVAFAAMTLWLVVLFTRTAIPRDGRVWVAFFVMGLLNNVVPFSLIVWGQQHIASGLAAILNGTTPLFTLLLAAAFLKDEDIGRRKLIGVVIGFFGVVIMLRPALDSGISSSLMGQLAILGAALSYGLAGTYGRRFKDLGVTPLITAAGQVTASAIILLPVTLLIDGVVDLPSSKVIINLLVLAVLCTAMAYLLYFRILASSGASNLSLVTLIVPVTAILLGIVFLGESLLGVHIIGMCLIAVSMAIIDGRLLSSLKLTRQSP